MSHCVFLYHSCHLSNVFCGMSFNAECSFQGRNSVSRAGDHFHANSVWRAANKSRMPAQGIDRGMLHLSTWREARVVHSLVSNPRNVSRTVLSYEGFGANPFMGCKIDLWGASRKLTCGYSIYRQFWPRLLCTPLSSDSGMQPTSIFVLMCTPRLGIRTSSYCAYVCLSVCVCGTYVVQH